MQISKRIYLETLFRPKMNNLSSGIRKRQINKSLKSEITNTIQKLIDNFDENKFDEKISKDFSFFL